MPLTPGIAGAAPAYAAVRHRTQKKLAEQQAVGPIVFSVFRATCHFGDQVRRRVIMAEQFVVRHQLSPPRTQPSRRSSARRLWILLFVVALTNGRRVVVPKPV